MWTDGFWHGGQNNVPIETTYIPMFVFLSFCKVNAILFFYEQFNNGHQILVQGSLGFFFSLGLLGFPILGFLAYLNIFILSYLRFFILRCIGYLGFLL
jgi:hypothetical protein